MPRTRNPHSKPRPTISQTRTNLRHRQATEGSVHVAHAGENKLRGAVGRGHEGACAARVIPIRDISDERRLAVDAQTAFVPEPACIARVLVKSVTVGCSGLEPNHRRGAAARNVQRKPQMVQTRGL